MSTIGPASFAAQIASSTSRTHRADADAARTAEAAERSRFHSAQHGPEATDDIAKPDLSSDRDADGRQPWEPPTRPAPADEAEPESEAPVAAPLDDIGRRLDLEA